MPGNSRGAPGKSGGGLAIVSGWLQALTARVDTALHPPAESVIRKSLSDSTLTVVLSHECWAGPAARHSRRLAVPVPGQETRELWRQPVFESVIVGMGWRRGTGVPPPGSALHGVADGRDRRRAGSAIYLPRMSQPPTQHGTQVPDRRGLPVVVALATFIVVVSGLVGIVALFGVQHDMWTMATTWILLRISEGLACVGLACSLLAAALTRPPLGYRGFIASVSSVITAGCIIWLILWWHARVTPAP